MRAIIGATYDHGYTSVMAKKDQKKRRDDTIAFKASEAERKAYENAAAKDDRTLSAWIRAILNREAGLTVKQ